MSHLVDSDTLRNIPILGASCFLLIQLILFYAAQILILNFQYILYKIFCLLMTIKYRQSRTYSENLKLFNRVNPHRAADANARNGKAGIAPEQGGLPTAAVPVGVRHTAVSGPNPKQTAQIICSLIIV